MVIIHWATWVEGGGYWGDGEGRVTDGRIVYSSLETYGDRIVDTISGVPAQKLPRTVQGCRKRYAQIQGITPVVQVLTNRRFPAPQCSLAGFLIKDMLNFLYSNAELEPDAEVAAEERGLDIRGIDELSAAINQFCDRNKYLWMLLLRFSWFRPERHSLGLDELEAALKDAEVVNKHHYIYAQCRSQIQLDDLFWLGRMADRADMSQIVRPINVEGKENEI